MSEKTIFEINGVKLEVDMRYARRIEELKIGSPVKLLSKNSYSGHKVFPGVIIGFEPFKDLPTIIVAYVEDDWSTAQIKVVSINAKQETFDIVAAVDKDFTIDRTIVLSRFEKQILAKEREIDAIKEQMKYFESNFAVFWAQVVSEKV